VHVAGDDLLVAGDVVGQANASSALGETS
jgi:hypothetical protein